MKLKKINGRIITVNITKYKIDWDKSCRSKFQFNVKQFFKIFWRNHFCAEEFRIPGSKMTIDLMNFTKHLAVEVQGEFHMQYNSWAHGGNRGNWRKQLERDVNKEKWCEENGFTLLEIFPGELDKLNRQFFLDKYNIDLV